MVLGKFQNMTGLRKKKHDITIVTGGSRNELLLMSFCTILPIETSVLYIYISNHY